MEHYGLYNNPKQKLTLMMTVMVMMGMHRFYRQFVLVGEGKETNHAVSPFWCAFLMEKWDRDQARNLKW